MIKIAPPPPVPGEDLEQGSGGTVHPQLFGLELALTSSAPPPQVKIWSKELAGQFTLSCVEEVWDIAVSGDICFTVRDKDITCSEIKFRE